MYLSHVLYDIVLKFIGYSIATITTIIKILKFNKLIVNINMNLLMDLPLKNSTINF